LASWFVVVASFGSLYMVAGKRHAEVSVFFLLNAIGLAVGLVALGIARYGLGLTSPLMLTVANGTGLVLGTGFRFWGCRRWVFQLRPRMSGGGEHDRAVWMGGYGGDCR
jgi:putative flippase GtrA